MNQLMIGDEDRISRTPGVATAGSIGDQVLWAPLRRPIAASGADSVLWEMLESPSSVAEIAQLVADEFKIEPGESIDSVRAGVATLWTFGLLTVGDNEPAEAPAKRFMAPSY